MLERIDSMFDIPALQQEFAAVKTGLFESQKNLTELYNLIKNFKDTNISTLAANTEALIAAINGSTQATGKASAAYDALTQKIAAQAQAIRDNNSSMAASNASYETLIKAAVRNKLAMDELTKSQKEVRAAFEKGETTNDQYLASLESIKTAQQALKVSNESITKSLNNMERQAQASGGSLDEMRAKLNLLNQTYDKLSATERDSEAGQGLLKNIQETDEAVKKLEADTGRFGREVGNYSGAFGKAFEVLKQQLATVKGQMGDIETKGKSVVNNLTGGNPIGFDPNRFKGQVSSFAKTDGTSAIVAPGDAATYQDLTNKAQLLESNIDRLSIGFKSTRQEARAFQETAVQLGLAIGQTDDKFLVFNEAVGEVQNGINDIKAATKFQAQDAKFIVGLTSAVNGLVGAYGAASAAVSILGGDEEDAQKSMAKFQQLLVLINGLQQVANALQEESGAMQLALAAKTALASAATKINTILTTEAIAAIKAQTIAAADLAAAEGFVAISAEEAAAAVTSTIAANTEATASALGLSLAEDEVAGSAQLATLAVTEFAGTAAVISGVAVVVVAVGAAVYFLVQKIREWMAATQLNAKQQKELNDALAAQVEALQKINDLRDLSGKKALDDLQHQLDLEEKSGQNQYAIFAIKEKIAAKNAEIANSKYAQVLAEAENKYVSQGLIGIDALHKAQNDYYEDLIDKSTKVDVIQKEYDATIGLTERQRKQKGVSDKDIDRIKDRLDAATAERNLAQKNYDYYAKGEKDRTDTENAQENLRIEREKFAAGERRKLVLETSKFEVDAAKDRNSKILDDDASTQQERLAAVRSIAAQERKLATAEYINVQQDPSTTPTQLLIAQRQLNAQIVQGNSDAKKQIEDINRSYYERTRDAQLQQRKDLLQGQVDLNEEILRRDKSSYNDRLTLATDSYNKLKAISGMEMLQALDKEGLIEEERLAIVADYNAKVLALNIKLGKDQEEEQKREQDRQLKLAEDFLQKQKDQISVRQSEQIKALNDKNNGTPFGTFGYDEKKAEIDRKAAEDNARAQIDADQRILAASKIGSKERADAEAKIQQDSAGLSQIITDKKLSDQDKLKDASIKAAEETTDLVQAAVDARYTNELNRIQQVIDKLEIRKAKDIERLRETGATQEEQAAAAIIINARVAQQEELLAIKQRKIKHDQAVADKAFGVAKATEDGVLAVLAALKLGPPAGPILAVIVGALAAVQIAKIIATPIPAYAEGTLDHPGGRALHSEAGEKEFILEPGRTGRWSSGKPTIESLLPHTKVIPASKIEDMIMSGMFVNREGALVSASDQGNKQELREIRDALIWQTQRLEAATKGSKTRIVNRVHVDTNWGTYINNAVFDKR